MSAFDVLTVSAVALRKESVDRNGLLLLTYHLKYGSRSPQGERG